MSPPAAKDAQKEGGSQGDGAFLPAGLIQTLLAKTRKLIVIYKLLFIRWPPILKEFIFSLIFSRLEGGKCIDDYFR